MKKIYSLTLLALLCSVGFKSNAQYVDLTGADNSIQTNYALDVVNGFTVEYQFYMETLKDFHGTVSQGVGNLPGPIDVYINGSGGMTILYGDGNAYNANNSSLTFEASVWYNVAHTYNPATNSGKLYVNGTLIDTYGLGSVGNGGSNLFIGDRADGATNADIQIREFKVWKGEKTPSAACLVGNETDLEVYYKMNEGSGAVCTDLATTNGTQNGSISGDVTWSTASVTGSISASATEIVAGTNVTFTATALNDGGTPSYQWVKNSANVGTDSDTYSDNTLVDSDVISCVITLDGSCSGSATSNEISITTVDPDMASIAFDGNDDYISIGTATGIPAGNNAYTIEAWMYPETHGNNGIAGWGNWGTNNEVNAFRLGYNGTDYFLVNYWWGNDLSVNVDNLSGEDWHHVAATYDGTTRSIYLDGVLVGSDEPGVALNVTITNNLQIGVTNITDFFEGALDNVMIWDIARTEEEISHDMNCVNISPTPHLIVNYTFDQDALPNGNNAGLTTTVDLSGNNNDGTLHNFTLVGGNSNWVWDPELVYTAPVINSIDGETSICEGDYAELYADVDADDVHWTSDNFDEWGNEGNFDPMDDEVFTVIAYNGGCPSAAETVTVTVKPLPNVNITVSDNTITSSEVTTGTTYAWYDCNDDYISGETNVDFTATAVGSYGVEVTLNGCVEYSECTDITAIVTAVNAADVTTVSIYPNPTSGDFTIETLQTEAQTVQLFDMNGRMVYSQVINGTTTISTNNLIGGVYQIRVTGTDKTATTKLVISK